MQSTVPRDSGFVQYSADINRAPIRWPNNARIALWVSPNVELYEFTPPASPYLTAWPRMPQPDVMGYSYRQFGNRVGFWRMLEVLDRYSVRATTSLNVAVLEAFPEICAAMVERNWEFMSHGLANTRYLYGSSEGEEREFYKMTAAIIREKTGKPLRGMLGPAYTSTPETPRLMAEAGLFYSADWFMDDQPFEIRSGSRNPLIGVPYTRQLNDAVVFKYTASEGEYFEKICKEQFDVLYEEGALQPRVMCIGLHPYVIGQAHRIKYLDRTLEYILSHEDVWLTTADEIASWFITEELGLKPPGSAAISSV